MLTMIDIEKIDKLVINLTQEKNEWMSLAIGIDLANELLKVILPNSFYSNEQLNLDSQNTGKLPNPLTLDTFKNQKQLKWFKNYPGSSTLRSAFKLFFDDNCALESNFFWLNESATKQKIAAATEYSRNWEDSELTRKPQYKVGIDFFLTPEANSLMIVLSNNQKLRVLELNGRLSNTQKIILKNKLYDAAAFTGIENGVQLEFEPQRTIHTALWNAFQIKEVNQQFYSYISAHFNELVNKLESIGKNSDDAKQFSSRLLGRLLFTWFLRKMEIINENAGYFDVEGLSATDYYNKKLKTLFFKVFNTEISERTTEDLITPYLNGGLFEAKENDFDSEILPFPSQFFTRLYSNFDEFNFTTDESSPEFELIAVDPEMLGQVFESLLASQTGNDDINERNKTGSFYTPREIVGYMVKETIRRYLYSNLDQTAHKGIDDLLDLSDSQWLDRKSTSNADIWGINSKKIILQIKSLLDNFKVLDPAAGSGAFPMGMLQQLLRTYERIETRFDPYKLKLSIIENNIYGIDIQPMAVEISRLRAWLSVIVDEMDKNNIKPLPNLEFKFIAANSLIKLESKQLALFGDFELDNKLQDLRDKYFNARTLRKKIEYQNKYYKLTTGQGNVFEDERTRQLKSFDPFKNRSAADFFDPKIMFGISEGFHAVIGNPPYGISFSNSEKKYLSDLYPNVPDYESSNYFISIAQDLLCEGGYLSYIIPNTVLTNVHAKNYREELLNEWTINTIYDLTNSKVFESAVVRNCIVSLSNLKTNSYESYFIQEKEKVTNFELSYEKKFSKIELQNHINSWLNLFFSNYDETILIDKIKKDSDRLDAYADVSQGIIPYDVHAGTPVEIKNSKAYHSLEKLDDSYKKLLKGADVRRYNVSWNGKQWIKYGPWLANMREERFFTQPRLLFREITNPYIYCAYTEDELYNNPSIINVEGFKEISPFYLLAISNSKLMNFYHKKNSPKANKGEFPKMLIKDVREMPIKLGTKDQIKKIESISKLLLVEKDMDEIEILSKECDSIINEVYGISSTDCKIIDKVITSNWLQLTSVKKSKK